MINKSNMTAGGKAVAEGEKSTLVFEGEWGDRDTSGTRRH